MGCDGGTIPKRCELVKTAKRGEQKDKDMDRKAKWSSCTISQQALIPPIVLCELGKLYSKESVLEFLLDRSISANASHLTSLKNVKELKLTPNPGYNEKSGLGDQYYDTQLAKYVCPIVGLEMNGKYKFCALWSCGCVLSKRALKEVETDCCHICGAKFKKEDIIVINPEGDDVTSMESNMETRREKVKAMRKEKNGKKMKKRKLDCDAAPAKEGAPNTTSLSNGVSSISKESNGIGRIKSAAKINKANDVGSNKLVDPKQSKIYKSLFTSGAEKRSRDQNAHWVTYNPYHL